jgi:uncharacterized membrane protein
MGRRSPRLREAPRHVRRSRLGREIAVVVCVKLILLLLLREVWFSHPQAKHLNGQAVAAALFGPGSAP